MHDHNQRPEYAAVRHILAAPPIAARTATYVRPDDFDWVGIRREAETMSGGERLLVDIAYELWTGEKATGVSELPRRLGPGSLRRVVEAIAACNGSTAVAPAAALP